MNKFVNILSLISIALAFTFCARPGSPGGGPRDMGPPKVTKSEPPNGSARFVSKKITITFNEFIELDNITQKAMISPPMNKMPDYKLKGKSLQIKFNEPLRPKTTYSIYFADAIVDITEQNALLNYTYIFSTGDKVDSMSLHGEVINSFNLEPAEEVFVMLYKNDNDTLPLDSLPLKVKPYYISKTGTNGAFQLNGLSNDEYLMFALRDLNANYIYDQPGEEIAFIDSMLKPEYFARMDLDSMKKQGLENLPDSVFYEDLDYVIDSIIADSIHKYDQQFTQYELFMFDELDSTQRLEKFNLLKKNIFQFAFSWPASSVEIIPINFEADSVWYIEDFSKNKDTITWFIKDLPIDTLELLVMNGMDTLEMITSRLDPKRDKPGVNRRKKKTEKKKEYLEFAQNFRGVIKLNQQPEFLFSFPVGEVISDSILLIQGEDSTYNPPFYFSDSTGLNRTMGVPVEIMEDTRYSIEFPDSSVIDWNGNHLQAKQSKFSTKSLRDYGILIVDIDVKSEYKYVFQLLSNEEEPIQEYYFTNDTTIKIELLEPGNYLLKLIYDSNGNRMWDNGNFTHHIQPEKVIYFLKELTVRANWDIEEEWQIEAP